MCDFYLEGSASDMFYFILGFGKSRSEQTPFSGGRGCAGGSCASGAAEYGTGMSPRCHPGVTSICLQNRGRFDCCQLPTFTEILPNVSTRGKT